MQEREPELALSSLVYDCFITELNALKPGNVGRHGAGHGMEAADFIESARVVTPVLCNAGLGLGEKVLRGVEATLAAVHCNTNLGMLLLIAPALSLLERKVAPAHFAGAIGPYLRSVRGVDARHIFEAITLANPGGLGRVAEYDVRAPGVDDIYTAMAAAQDRDLVARQYANGYREVLATGVTRLQACHNRWNSVEWAVVACYLAYMASLPDSHVRRKSGADVAASVQRSSALVAQRFFACDDPEQARGMLMAFDAELKGAGINPGACADLTVASLLLYRLGVGGEGVVSGTARIQ